MSPLEPLDDISSLFDIELRTVRPPEPLDDIPSLSGMELVERSGRRERSTRSRRSFDIWRASNGSTDRGELRRRSTRRAARERRGSGSTAFAAGAE
jgi:hypothetical protein